ncbi:MAG: sigma-70 family RNA polymerase sigma factor [Chloroflexi bacterium]|nr:sigma-70 family RNA polymerase sigma factor [Chloroflexota bacterium]
MLTLAELVDHCAQETERFFHGQAYDPQYCFELFQRAILEEDQLAWEAIHVQYQTLVIGWVKHQRGFATSGEEAQYFVNRAFEKIWVALTPEKFERFSDLGALLHYLKLCVHSAIVDHNRARNQANLYALAEDSPAEEKAQGPTVEDWVFDRAYRQRFWDWINARLHDEKERQVVYGSFVLALKPRELYEQFRAVFIDVEEVYRIKQNIMARLRRDPEFNKFLDERD